ncbi:MAG: outer membrane lipoprotein carrier protein LolA [Alphaproteobacteria bacterium]|nr:outer membrane lipoprotein carrier protein LolA [Alphaproteobacteria bacterium]
MKKLLLLILLGLFPLFAAPCVYAAVPAHPSFSAQDKKDLSRIADYLNGLKNISADFLQVDDAGGILHGEIAISRPGKMRVDYNPPDKDFIIADGSIVHIWDDSLKAQTNVDQGTSLAEFILRDPIKMSGDVTVTKIQHSPAKIEVTLVQTNDPDAGSLTLVFEDNPLKLRQWKVVDAEGRSTAVSLENMSEGAVFPATTFIFTPPNFEKNP